MLELGTSRVRQNRRHLQIPGNGWLSSRAEATSFASTQSCKATNAGLSWHLQGPTAVCSRHPAATDWQMAKPGRKKTAAGRERQHAAMQAARPGPAADPLCPRRLLAPCPQQLRRDRKSSALLLVPPSVVPSRAPEPLSAKAASASSARPAPFSSSLDSRKRFKASACQGSLSPSLSCV